MLTGYLNQRDRGGLNYDPNFYWQSAIAKYIRFKNTLLISNDGKTLIKGKFGTKVKRWDIATGKSVMEFVGHKKAVLCYDLSSDGKRLLTGGGDGKIMLWNVEQGIPFRSFNRIANRSLTSILALMKPRCFFKLGCYNEDP